jgi:hypothetical protein
VEGGDDFKESSEACSRFADEAPDEIRADLELMAETYEKHVDAIAGIGLEPGETPSAEQGLSSSKRSPGSTSRSSRRHRSGHDLVCRELLSRSRSRRS